MTNVAMGSILFIPLILLWLAAAGLGIYVIILVIKLAHRGIKALDIYIYNNEKGHKDNG